MSKKSAKIAGLIESFRGGKHDAHYLSFFECFNTGLFYEAHDVLEELWLGDRHGPTGNFYKGLIQLAGAFVLMQKHTAARPRLQPAARLFRLARVNLAGYPAVYQDVSISEVVALIDFWVLRLEEGKFEANPLETTATPKLSLPGQ